MESTPIIYGQPAPSRPWRLAMWRGLRSKCPSCGEGSLFRSFLKTNPSCPVCGEELHHERSDDAAPYFTIFIVGHIVVPAMLMVERAFWPPIWLHLSIWLPLTLILALAFLTPIKGTLIGLQWALRMHGFGEPDSEPAG